MPRRRRSRKLDQLRKVMGGEKLGRKYPVKRLMDRVNKLGKRSPILCTGESMIGG